MKTIEIKYSTYYKYHYTFVFSLSLIFDLRTWRTYNWM